MLMVVVAVVMRGAGGEVILGGGVQAKDHARVDDAVGHGQHRQAARLFSSASA